jgi:5-methylcytosine-specific restriction protein A
MLSDKQERAMSLQYRDSVGKMTVVGTTENAFLPELRAQIRRAQKRGATHIEINAGELHRVVGGYPGPNHRMPMCCHAMTFEKRAEDEVICGPKRGVGASLTIRYALPR